jgi:excisionase family DNA binding protein
MQNNHAHTLHQSSAGPDGPIISAYASSQMQPLLLTAANAAKLLSISQRTLWALTQQGKVHVIRIGRSVRYSLTELQRWIAAQ